MAAEIPSAFTPDVVRSVARLARLAVDEARLPEMSAQLQPILGYIDQINAVDVAGVEPMDHAVPLHNVLRDDVPSPALPLDQVLRNAPEAEPPFFKVPKVLGGDEDSAG